MHECMNELKTTIIMWGPSCSHRTKIMGFHPDPQNYNMKKLSFPWSQKQIQRPDYVFGLHPL